MGAMPRFSQVHVPTEMNDKPICFLLFDCLEPRAPPAAASGDPRSPLAAQRAAPADGVSHAGCSSSPDAPESSALTSTASLTAILKAKKTDWGSPQPAPPGISGFVAPEYRGAETPETLVS